MKQSMGSTMEAIFGHSIKFIKKLSYHYYRSLFYGFFNQKLNMDNVKNYKNLKEQQKQRF